MHLTVWTNYRTHKKSALKPIHGIWRVARVRSRYSSAQPRWKWTCAPHPPSEVSLQWLDLSMRYNQQHVWVNTHPLFPSLLPSSPDNIEKKIENWELGTILWAFAGLKIRIVIPKEDLLSVYFDFFVLLTEYYGDQWLFKSSSSDIPERIEMLVPITHKR